MFRRLLVLVVLWVMAMVSLLILDRMGLIDIVGEGKVFGISFKTAGAAAFVIIFLAVLVFLLGKIRPTADATRSLVRSLGL
jgi:hypothetical protein